MAILRGRERKLMWRRITTVGWGARRPVRHKIPLGILIFLVCCHLLVTKPAKTALYRVNNMCLKPPLITQ